MKIFTTKDAAEKLHCSERTIRRMCKDETLHAIKHPRSGRWMIREDSVEKFWLRRLMSFNDAH